MLRLLLILTLAILLISLSFGLLLFNENCETHLVLLLILKNDCRCGGKLKAVAVMRGKERRTIIIIMQLPDPDALLHSGGEVQLFH